MTMTLERLANVLQDMVNLAREDRCIYCGWPVKDTIDEGCTKQVCRFCPSEHSAEYAAWRERQDAMGRKV